MKYLFSLALLTSASCGFAAQKMQLETPVRYLPEAKVAASTKQECRVELRIANHVRKMLVKHNRRAAAAVGAESEGQASNAHTLLRIAIAEVTGDGGVVINDTRAVTLRGTIVDGSAEPRTITITRSAPGGSHFLPMGNCQVVARSLSFATVQVFRWARNPATKVVAAAEVKASETESDDDEDDAK